MSDERLEDSDFIDPRKFLYGICSFLSESNPNCNRAFTRFCELEVYLKTR